MLVFACFFFTITFTTTSRFCQTKNRQPVPAIRGSVLCFPCFAGWFLVGLPESPLCRCLSYHASSSFLSAVKRERRFATILPPPVNWSRSAHFKAKSTSPRIPFRHRVGVSMHVHLHSLPFAKRSPTFTILVSGTFRIWSASIQPNSVTLL